MAINVEKLRNYGIRIFKERNWKKLTINYFGGGMSMRSLFFFSISSTEPRSTRSEFSPSSISSVDHKNKKGAEFFGGFKIII
jgi:hypothetical protein